MHMKNRRLCVLGSTGSIGVNALSVAEHLGMSVHAISAHNNHQLLVEQTLRYNVKRVVVTNEDHYQTVKQALAGHAVEVFAGHKHLDDIAADDDVDTVLTAIVGAIGLQSTLAACRAGKRICIANKEPLVIAGRLVMETAQKHNAQVIPVDSEHSAIWQCIEQHKNHEIRDIYLTGSGGPLRGRTDLTDIKKEDALQHPNWSMGDKITIDSATLMNKGLELIEAHHLFNMSSDHIKVIIHPESIIHSMVAYKDGSVIAQLGLPDMRTPIQYALTWPEHKNGLVETPNFIELGSLNFEDVNHDLFPSIQLARQSLELGDFGPCALNAANEIAVDQYLKDQIAFQDIFKCIESTLPLVTQNHNASIQDIINFDTEMRQRLQS